VIGGLFVAWKIGVDMNGVEGMDPGSRGGEIDCQVKMIQHLAFTVKVVTVTVRGGDIVVQAINRGRGVENVDGGAAQKIVEIPPCKGVFPRRLVMGKDVAYIGGLFFAHVSTIRLDTGAAGKFGFEVQDVGVQVNLGSSSGVEAKQAGGRRAHEIERAVAYPRGIGRAADGGNTADEGHLIPPEKTLTDIARVARFDKSGCPAVSGVEHLHGGCEVVVHLLLAFHFFDADEQATIEIIDQHLSNFVQLGLIGDLTFGGAGVGVTGSPIAPITLPIVEVVEEIFYICKTDIEFAVGWSDRWFVCNHVRAVEGGEGLGGIE
jgi:hypothetical protein